MLFYDLNNDKKEKMYAELLSRRRKMTEIVEADNKEALAAASEAQINAGKM